jgi:hypothetical protein
VPRLYGNGAVTKQATPAERSGKGPGLGRLVWNRKLGRVSPQGAPRRRRMRSRRTSAHRLPSPQGEGRHEQNNGKGVDG